MLALVGERDWRTRWLELHDTRKGYAPNYHGAARRCHEAIAGFHLFQCETSIGTIEGVTIEDGQTNPFRLADVAARDSLIPDWIVIVHDRLSQATRTACHEDARKRIAHIIGFPPLLTVGINDGGGADQIEGNIERDCRRSHGAEEEGGDAHCDT